MLISVLNIGSKNSILNQFFLLVLIETHYYSIQVLECMYHNECMQCSVNIKLPGTETNLSGCSDVTVYQNAFCQPAISEEHNNKH